MKTIFLEDDLRVRFPGREDAFNEGFEVGMLAALMAQGLPRITRSVSGSAVEMLQPLAQRLGYRVIVRPGADNQLVTLERATLRPRLRVAETA